MARIFISYRRDDSGGWAGRLYERLSQHCGRDHVFMDIDTIEPGLDFVEVIQEAVGSCDALIAVIGRQWLTSADAVRQRRIDNPEDFVRVEIAAALKRNIRMIPVLVQGAPMPRSTDLPGVLQSLSRWNALEISDTRFHSDVDRLIEVLEPVLRAIEVTATQPTSESPEAERQVQTGEVRPPVRSAHPWLVADPTGKCGRIFYAPGVTAIE